MKKMLLAVLVAICVAFTSSAAIAQTMPDKKVIAGFGFYQMYINFDFIVPTGNCDNFAVLRYEPHWNIPNNTPAAWVWMEPGTLAPRGFYKIINMDLGCSPVVVISGVVDEIHNINTWQAREIEPEEAGMFVWQTWGGSWEENNYFNLSTDDREYSYYLLMPGKGMKTPLSVFSSAGFIDMSGQFVGAIICNSWGFLVEQVSLRRNCLIDEDDVIVLIYKENYPVYANIKLAQEQVRQIIFK